MVEHVSLAFHWHRFVCFWILYNICRAHHGMAVPEGKYLYWKTTIWLGYILTQWGRCRGQPFSCWALEPLVVKSGENMNILILLFMGKIWTFSFSSIRCICSPMQNHQVSCRKQCTLLSQAWLWTVESEMTTFICKKFLKIMQWRHWTFQRSCYCENLWDVSSSFLHIVPIVAGTVDHQTSLLLNLPSWGDITNILFEANY